MQLCVENRSSGGNSGTFVCVNIRSFCISKKNEYLVDVYSAFEVWFFTVAFVCKIGSFFLC